MTQVLKRGDAGTAWGSDVPAPPDKYDSLGRRTGPQSRAYQKLPAADLRWQDQAACKAPGIEPSWFFSEKRSDVEAALTVCESCPVRTECGAERELLGIQGVWGGTHWVLAAGHIRPSLVRMVDTPAYRRKVVRRRRVLALTQSGLNAPEVAAVLDVHRQTVKNDLRTLGVE